MIHPFDLKPRTSPRVENDDERCAEWLADRVFNGICWTIAGLLIVVVICGLARFPTPSSGAMEAHHGKPQRVVEADAERGRG